MLRLNGMVRRLLAAAGLTAMIALALSLTQLSSTAAEPRGDAAAGKAVWGELFCSRCHGVEGEGAFGPDLAGRGLSFEQFQRAVRVPWGIMPAFTEQQLSDETLTDIHAYFASLGRVAAPGPWRVPVPPAGSQGQRFFAANGCGQCHGLTADRLRLDLGQEGVQTLDRLTNLVYRHTDSFPTGRMGNFNELRVPRTTLEAIWGYLSKELGLRVPVVATMTAGTPAGDRASYSFTIENRGAFSAGQVFIAAVIPSGSTLVGATAAPGAGFRGVEGGGAVPQSAVWLAAEIPAKGSLGPFTFEVQGPGAAAGSRVWVRWLSPTVAGDETVSRQVAFVVPAPATAPAPAQVP